MTAMWRTLSFRSLGIANWCVLLSYIACLSATLTVIAPPILQSNVTFCDFVDIYNSLVDRVKLQNCLLRPGAASATHSGGPSSSSSTLTMRSSSRRNVSGSAYLVSGAALKIVNGVYTQNGESDGVPKYTYTSFSLLRRTIPGGARYWYAAAFVSNLTYFYIGTFSTRLLTLAAGIWSKVRALKRAREGHLCGATIVV